LHLLFFSSVISASQISSLSLHDALPIVLIQFAHLSCAGHGVPLVPDPTRREDQGEMGTKRFQGRFWTRNGYLRPSVGSRKYLICKKPFGSSLFLVYKWPLSGSLGLEIVIIECRNIDIRPLSQAAVFPVHLRHILIVKFGKPHLTGKPQEDFGIRQRLPRGLIKFCQVADAPFGVGHSALLLPPTCRRQYQIRIRNGLIFIGN